LGKIRVLLADDHGVVRKGLRLLLEEHPEIEVVGEAADGRDVVRLARELAPDVVLMDIAMPLLNGIDAAAQIRNLNDRTGVIILSMHCDEGYLIRALNAGVKGYLLKESAENDLFRAIESVSRAKPFFSPGMMQMLVEDYMRVLKQEGLQDRYELLTEREREVLQLLAEGKTNKDVAKILNLSLHTVESHRTNLMQKLDLHNTAEIVLYAVRKNIVR
jgi:two-component system, NarL family, response regulator NreC